VKRIDLVTSDLDQWRGHRTLRAILQGLQQAATSAVGPLRLPNHPPPNLSLRLPGRRSPTPDRPRASDASLSHTQAHFQIACCCSILKRTFGADMLHGAAGTVTTSRHGSGSAYFRSIDLRCLSCTLPRCVDRARYDAVFFTWPRPRQSYDCYHTGCLSRSAILTVGPNTLSGRCPVAYATQANKSSSTGLAHRPMDSFPHRSLAAMLVPVFGVDALRLVLLFRRRGSGLQSCKVADITFHQRLRDSDYVRDQPVQQIQ
jgi:hypothetical protein